jgi:RNA polymerase sigma-70 factor (ECF subfamily)
MRPEAFERLFDEHAQPLFAFLVYRSGERGLAEDLVADTFERALRARRRFDPRRGSEKQWLYTIAVNLLRDHARRASVERRAIDRVAAVAGPGSTEHETDGVERSQDLMHALSSLTEDEREALALRFGADLTMREVARVLGQKEDAVEARIYRALGKLRQRLG